MFLISPEIEYIIVRFFLFKKDGKKKNPITWKMSIMILMFNMSLPYRLSYRAYSWQSFHHNKSNRNTIFTRKQTSCPQTTTISISYHYHFLWHMLKETEVGSERWIVLYTYNKLHVKKSVSIWIVCFGGLHDMYTTCHSTMGSFSGDYSKSLALSGCPDHWARVDKKKSFKAAGKGLRLD